MSKLSSPAVRGFLEKRFELRKNATDVKTEVLAGLTTFMTMAYILAVNPEILSAAGMDWGGVFTASILASIFGTLIMAFIANYPFVLAPGMGINAFFAFVVCNKMGKPWQFALTAVFIEGLIFIFLSTFKVRETLFDAIPSQIKNAVSVGIGLFISLVGLKGAGIIVSSEATLVQLGDITQPAPALALFGLLITGFMLAKKVKGALLYGIFITTALSVIAGVTSLPDKLMSLPPSIAPVAFKLQWADIFTWDMLIVVFTFLFVDMFDTIGTLVGVSSKADMLDENGKLPKVSSALLADALATTGGALTGTSTVTTYVESAAGVAAGGRTGLTALTSAGLFALALFFAPIFRIIPGCATAPALILVGLFMMTPIRDVNFDDFTDAVPAFLTIIMMPFAFSIAEGIVYGMISFVILKLVTGKHKEISIPMYILALLFLLRIVMPLFQ